LEWLKNYLYPSGIHCLTCGEITKHHRMKKRPSYSCDRCGHHVHPMAGTIYQDTRTPLKLWFYATYIMAQTRCGISAKQLQREIGVTYKTAWRMFKQIRSLLHEDFDDMGKDKGVELDETWIGGKPRHKAGEFPRKRGPKPGADKKTPVLGIAERRGNLHATVTPNVRLATMLPVITERIMPKAIIYTDEAPRYKSFTRRGYDHRRVHHASKVWVRGDAHTNTLEGFWSLLKRGIGGVYHSVSRKHLQTYLDEYTFRYNHRNDEQPIFQTMLGLVSR